MPSVHQDNAVLSLNRRQFIERLMLAGAAVSVGYPRISMGETIEGETALSPLQRGDFVDLTIGEMTVDFTGRKRQAITINGQLPASLLRFREGDTLRVRVHNALKEDSSIHWHGLLVPANMDGVPGFSFEGIKPGQSFVYEFPLKQSGTYWYHSHSSMQEAQGLYGPIIIEPKEAQPYHADREHIVMLSDWSDTKPQFILDRLRKQGSYYNYQQRTVGDFFRDMREQGFAAAWADRKVWGQMRMTPTDLADVTGITYSYLVNGQTAKGNWTGIFKKGEKVRLRFINAAAMTYFDVRIPGLRMTVVAADGQEVEPVQIDEFRLGVAETLDVMIEPVAEAYTLFAQSMDRSGYARGTLATVEGLVAAIPVMDKRPLLTMEDMGHGGMDHAGVGRAGESHAGANHEGMHRGGLMQSHPVSEKNNPGVDMQTMMPVPRLDDPGIGLRDLIAARGEEGKGKKVLTYSDLKSRERILDQREPVRDLEFHLTGHMERYVWSFDGVPYEKANPVVLKYGERIRIILVNDTMMEHPIHLHGMWSDLEDEHGHVLVRKHTISMPPGTRRSFRVTADALGRWAFHCHLLMHMDTGMFREVRVEA